MSDNRKIVKLDENNKIVIEDNNSVTTIEGTTSKLEGVYEISDSDVAKLLLLINNNTIVKNIMSYTIMGSVFVSGKCTHEILTCDEALEKALEITSKEYNELLKEHKELQDRHMTMRSNFDNLLEKVEKHNKHSLFNKIKMD